jgi:hypothetical protein
LIVVITGFRIWTYFFVTHKTYSEGDSYPVAGYVFRVNAAYYTDKDLNGNKITGRSNFLIIDMSVVNRAEARMMNLENFHVRNMSEDYVTTRRLYVDLFQDLGVAYESTQWIKKGERLDFIIIYKVDKKLNKNRFSLSYQEKSGILRKIKLKIQDLSIVDKEIEKLSLGDELVLNLQKEEETIRFDYVSLEKSITYLTRTCRSSNCSPKEKSLKADSGTRFLKIDFISDTYEAKNMIDFLMNYGKLNYIDDKDDTHDVEIQNPISETYYGKSVFLRVPGEVKSAKSVYFDFVIRNKHYQYELIRRNENE